MQDGLHAIGYFFTAEVVRGPRPYHEKMFLVTNCMINFDVSPEGVIEGASTRRRKMSHRAVRVPSNANQPPVEVLLPTDVYILGAAARPPVFPRRPSMSVAPCSPVDEEDAAADDAFARRQAPCVPRSFRWLRHPPQFAGDHCPLL
jgi:hypothetical protein